MNDTASSFFVVLLFILRCLVPLAILFGISYLLRRMGLVAIDTPDPDPYEKLEEKPTRDSSGTTAPPKLTSVTRPKKPGKGKAGTPRKKTTGKKTTGKSRSRSK